ncbi:MAG: toll/interleukin-1 receptor domain-containing protein, partial [Pseudomonadota bacterium]
MAKGRIFISYRRGLDQGTTGRLYDRLERHYDREQLFMDVDDIPPGANFSSYLEEQIEKCDVFLIVIGKGWIDAMDRLQNADDFVRLEIEGALRRQSAAVIPVLLDGVSMPDRRDLPDSLHPLCMRQAIGVQNQSFATDVDVSLRKVLDQVLPGSSRYIQRLPDT